MWWSNLERLPLVQDLGVLVDVAVLRFLLRGGGDVHHLELHRAHRTPGHKSIPFSQLQIKALCGTNAVLCDENETLQVHDAKVMLNTTPWYDTRVVLGDAKVITCDNTEGPNCVNAKAVFRDAKATFCDAT